MYTLKKSLGQHFLKDENISRKIVEMVLETPAIRDQYGQAVGGGEQPGQGPHAGRRSSWKWVPERGR